ncbi:MAG: hypothetical protein KDE05_12120 [Parvularculaceae bacterium]|nr:hypothetical protein [Parvularculaceae bacterium]
MILRRVIEHVKKQEWTAVFLDFVIVVFGVFIGIQVSNWNAARVDRERSEDYLSRIQTDLESDMHDLQQHKSVWERVAAEGYAAIEFAETGDRGVATDWEILRSFLHASQSWTFNFVDTTYSELRSAGELGLIADADLQSALADYYVAIIARRGGGGHYSLMPEYREMVRGRMRSDIMRYYWRECFRQAAGVQDFIDCPPPPDVSNIGEVLERLIADAALVDALRYWVDTQSVATELAEFDLGRARALIDRVEAKK